MKALFNIMVILNLMQLPERRCLGGGRGGETLVRPARVESPVLAPLAIIWVIIKETLVNHHPR
jgi:hypothetical protein